MPLLAAALAATGTHLVWSALALGRRDLPRPSRRPERAAAVEVWLRQAGLGDASPRGFAAASAATGLVAATVVVVALGAALPALASGAVAATIPWSVLRERRRARRLAAQEAWPGLIEEIRLLTGSVGRSVPHALFEAGRHAPAELADAFADAHRAWLLTTDFGHTIDHLKARLADPTADAACETLLVAHEVGGTSLDARLAALAEDRLADLTDRKDAIAKQAGVRFARRFVIIVPVAMAGVGLTIGDGRAAYATPTGQLAVLGAMALMAACWLWAGRLLALPDEPRVLAR